MFFYKKALSQAHYGVTKACTTLQKGLQLLIPDKFENIFLGLGGFRLEQIVSAHCGKFL